VARRRVVTLAAGGLLALAAALVAIPGIASAHYLTVSLSCSSQNSPTLTIVLTQYTTPTVGHHNSVSASIDGTSVLSTTDFTNAYSNTFSAGSPYTSHTAQVIVYAWDDPTGSHGWTKTFNLSTNACKTATPSPTPTHTPSPTPTHTPSPTPTHTPSPTPTHTPSPTPTATPVPTPTATPVPTPTATPVPTPTATPVPTDTPFESFQGETATPYVSPTPYVTPTPYVSPTPYVTPTDPVTTETPFESFQGETSTPAVSMTPPPTSTGGSGSSDSSTPLFALMICLAFGGLGIAAAQAQRRTVRR
jgi:hypothetical protein